MAGSQETGQFIEVVADRNQGRLYGSVVADLCMANVGQKGVAEALAADGLVEFAAARYIAGLRLGGTAIADLPIGFGIGFAQKAEVAEPVTFLVDFG